MRVWPSAVYNWGSTAVERSEPFPCDRLLPDAQQALYRAVDVEADPAIVFRWLCQLRAAPYSYDRIDNGGRRSPPTLTPGLERLVTGQRVMSIFRLVEFEPDRSITLSHRGRLFGEIACSYRVGERAGGGSRLVVKLLVGRPAGPFGGAPARGLLAPGDLVMMRRQLLNLKALAEADAAGGRSR